MSQVERNLLFSAVLASLRNRRDRVCSINSGPEWRSRSCVNKQASGIILTCTILTCTRNNVKHGCCFRTFETHLHAVNARLHVVTQVFSFGKRLCPKPQVSKDESHVQIHTPHSENVIWSNKLFAKFFNNVRNLSPLETSSSSECTLTCFYSWILHWEEIMP